MQANDKIFYRAMLAKDRRFDGRFFVGVHTTGIYCRSICPARKPKFINVSFYQNVAAAEAAGFRPCRRCRPESAPGTSFWLGTSATVSRALRLIHENRLGPAGIESLAEKLGISDRHLRQLFADQVGASPIAVSQLARLDFARRLVDQSALPLTEIAFASGFSSIRRFNDAFVKRFGKSPSAFRKKPKQDQGLKLNIPYRPPFEWNSMIKFFQDHVVAGLETCTPNSYGRTLRLGDEVGYFVARHNKDINSIEVEIYLPKLNNLMEAVAAIRNIFDLDADPLTIMKHLDQNGRLKALVKQYPGLRIPGSWNGFELAVRTIVGQQVSVKAACTLMHRFAKKYGEPVHFENQQDLQFIFPRPQDLAGKKLSVDGILAQRLTTIEKLTSAVVTGDLDLENPIDSETLRKNLTAIPGIGPWSAQYIAMRALKDPDAFPDTDLVIKREMAKFGKKNQSKILEEWRPWRAYATMYLWKGATTYAKSV